MGDLLLDLDNMATLEICFGPWPHKTPSGRCMTQIEPSLWPVPTSYGCSCQQLQHVSHQPLNRRFIPQEASQPPSMYDWPDWLPQTHSKLPFQEKGIRGCGRGCDWGLEQCWPRKQITPAPPPKMQTATRTHHPTRGLWNTDKWHQKPRGMKPVGLPECGDRCTDLAQLPSAEPWLRLVSSELLWLTIICTSLPNISARTNIRCSRLRGRKCHVNRKLFLHHQMVWAILHNNTGPVASNWQRDWWCAAEGRKVNAYVQAEDHGRMAVKGHFWGDPNNLAEAYRRQKLDDWQTRTAPTAHHPPIIPVT